VAIRDADVSDVLASPAPVLSLQEVHSVDPLFPGRYPDLDGSVGRWV
jgi:hypothetical protein